jgi:hypothetical protein
MIDFFTRFEPSDKLIQEIKDRLEKEHKREFSWEEARKMTWSLKSFAEVALKMADVEIRRRKRLQESPKGFHLDESQPCVLCGNRVVGDESWYDKNGIKCIYCQRAINQKIIPVTALKNKESWYSTFELEHYFNINKKLLGKFLKGGVLKDRKVLNEKRKIHLQIFLIKDNKDFLPPKNLVSSRTVKVIYKGEEHFTSEFWYEYVDVLLAKKLAKYKIGQYLPELFSQPMKGGRFYYKSINPLFAPKKIWEARIKNHDDFARANDKSTTG